MVFHNFETDIDPYVVNQSLIGLQSLTIRGGNLLFLRLIKVFDELQIYVVHQF